MFDLAHLRDALRAAAAAGDARYPEALAAPGPGFRGRVEVDFNRCTLTGACAEACPTNALALERDGERRARLTLDLGHCVFCGLCEEACGEGAVRLGDAFELAARRREDLVTTGFFVGPPRQPAAPPTASAKVTAEATTAAAVRERAVALLRRSLRIFHFDAGSCGGCEEEAAATAGPVHDLTRLGMRFVSAPPEADLLLVSGTLARGMETSLRAAWAALPAPRLVVALGACAIGGGIHRPSYGGEADTAASADGGVGGALPVDVWVPGCPPRPQAILHGLLLALDRVPQKVRAETWRGALPG